MRGELREHDRAVIDSCGEFCMRVHERRGEGIRLVPRRRSLRRHTPAAKRHARTELAIQPTKHLTQHYTITGFGSGTMNLPRYPFSRSFGISSSAICHENSRA